MRCLSAELPNAHDLLYSRGWGFRIPFIETDRAGIELSPVLDAVAHEFGLSPRQLKGDRRGRVYSVPRQFAMYMMREWTGRSFPEIAAFLGKRDHTTVIYGARKTEERLREMPEMREHRRRVAMWLRAFELGREDLVR